MTRPIKTALIVVTTLGCAAGIAWAGGQGGVKLGGIPVVALCAILAFAVQWVAFVPAWLARTEHFYDLVGSLTYAALTLLAVLAAGATDARSLVLAVLVLVWAARLGTYLFLRVRSRGSDSRFDDMKTRGSSFFIAWTMQGAWVFVTLCAALAAITSRNPAEIGWLDGAGILIWTFGFTIEVVADRQKSRFRVEHPGRFIDTGLWAWSRHPNYFGEIVLWIGIALIASSTLQGWQWVTWISPLFVIFLLTCVSGIPMSLARSDKRWGDDADYQRYRASTPLLVPRPPR